MKESVTQQNQESARLSRHTDFNPRLRAKRNQVRATRKASVLGSIRKSATDEDAEMTGFTIPEPPRKTLLERMDRNGKAKIYRLKGYTSVARVNRKQRRDDARHRVIRIRIVLTLIAVVLIMILIWNPFPAIIEFFHAFGF